jgi:hypothetical protein
MHLTSIAVPLLCIALLSGCAFRPAVTADAVSFNRSVEDASNRLILMNILRAAMRMPMQFTELTKVTGSIGGKATFPFTLPFDGKGGEAGPSFEMSGSDSFDILNLSTQEFMNGIMSPVAPSLFRHFWDQGWTKDLLLHLFVHEARVGNRELQNDPSNARELADFTDWVSCVVNSDPQLLSESKRAEQPIVEGIENVSAEEAVAALEKGFRLERHGSRFALYPIVSGVRLTWSPGKCGLPANGRAKSTAARDEGAPGVVFLQAPNAADQTAGLNEAAIRERSLGRDGGGPTEPSFELRSPEAILYYLGELVRQEMFWRGDAPNAELIPLPMARERAPDFSMPRVHLGPDDSVSPTVPGGWALIAVKRGRDFRSPVTVRRDTEIYSISGKEGDWEGSMACLRILTQLIALQKSSKTPPGTPTVIGIGRF